MSRSDRGEFFAHAFSANAPWAPPGILPPPLRGTPLSEGGEVWGRPFGAPPSERGANHPGFIGKRGFDTPEKRLTEDFRALDRTGRADYDGAMQRTRTILFPLLLAFAAALLAGCATSAMKGTPFYSGEVTRREGPASDRVNLWPIAYWRDPALSILWPLGEFSDDRIALRPLYAQYRQRGPDSPYSLYRSALGLVEFDTLHHRHRVFPVFWGRSGDERYLHVFPLYWSAVNDSGDNRLNALFPLWIYDRTRKPGGDDTDFWLAWPLYHRRRTPDVRKDALFPLWSRQRDSSGAAYDRYGLFLAGNLRDSSGHRHWIFPLYYCDKEADTFLSLPYAKRGANRAIPLLLTGWGPERGRILLGLGGWNQDESWLLPLYYQGGDTFLSLPYAAGPGYRAVPPLLSAWGDDWGLLACGLVGWNDSAHWLAPLYYRDAEDGLFLSPFYAESAGDWCAIPPLLSAWGGNWGRIALGLAGWEGAPGSGNHRSWIAPLYYQDEDHFLTPLYAHVRRQTILPPLLSAWHDGGNWGRIALGLAGWDRTSHWVWPLYYRDSAEDILLTPLFGRFGDGDRYWATPLFGTHEGHGGITGSWLFPLWNLRWRGLTYDHRFLLLGGASRTDADNTSVWFNPLFTAKSNARVDSLRAEMDATHAPDRKLVRHGERTDAKGARTEWTEYEKDFAGEHTHVLLGLGGASHRVRLNPGWWDSSSLRGLGDPKGGPLALFLHPPSADATNAVARYLAEDSNWFFPLWDSERRRGTMFDVATGKKTLDAELETFSALWFLYDWKHESVPAEGHDYVRRRVLWRLYHYERLDGDESTDIFPAITWDRRKDGYRKASFLWRLFRYEHDPEKGTSLDILFLPIRRP